MATKPFPWKATERFLSKSISVLFALIGVSLGITGSYMLWESPPLFEPSVFDDASKWNLLGSTGMLFLGVALLCLYWTVRFWRRRPDSGPEPLITTAGEISRTSQPPTAASRESGDTLYTTHYKWRGRLLTAAVVAWFAWRLIPEVPERLRSDDWHTVASTVAFVAIGVSFSAELLATFVRRTQFTETGIWHRSDFGKTRFLRYNDVQEIALTPRSFLSARLSDGCHLEVDADQGDPEAILQAISPYLDPQVQVLTYGSGSGKLSSS